MGQAITRAGSARECRTYCCALCGYWSEAESFFRPEKSGLLYRRKLFCAGCQPYVPTQREVSGLWTALSFLAAGVAIIAAGPQDRVYPEGYLPLLFGSFLLAHVVTTAVHELGHAAAAWLAGMKVICVAVGTGPALARRRWGDTDFMLGTYFLAGGITWAYHRAPNPGRWREGLMIVGGAAANFAAAALGILFFAWLFGTGRSLDPALIFVGYGLVLSQLAAAACSLVPHRSRIGSAVLASDGAALLGLLRQKDFAHQAQVYRLYYEGVALLEAQRYAAAQQHYTAAYRQVPAYATFFSHLVHSTGLASGARAAVQCYLGLDAPLEATAGHDKIGLGWAYGNVAWHALLTDDPALLPLADALSGRALDALPEAGEIQATRGAALVRLGQADAGLDLLIEGMRRTGRKADKADFATFLAEAERARGNPVLADEWEMLGAHYRRSAGAGDSSVIR